MSDSSASLPRERLAEAISSLWWVPLVRGVLLLVLGGYALFRPGMSAIALMQVVGAFMIADGVLAIIAGILGQTPSRLWTIVRGALAILVGLFVFAHPMAVAAIATEVVIYVVAFSMILCGLVEIVAAIRDRKEIEGEGWLILGGALAVLFGVVLLVMPIAFGLLMVRVLGGFAIVYGIALIALAFRLRKFGKSLKG
jgi:uncharacterized membrane protein HdeD (DUF308 family)